MRLLKNPMATFALGLAVATIIAMVPIYTLGKMNVILFDAIKESGAFCETCTPEQVQDLRLYAQNPNAYRLTPFFGDTPSADTYPGKSFGGGPLGYPEKKFSSRKNCFTERDPETGMRVTTGCIS